MNDWVTNGRRLEHELWPVRDYALKVGTVRHANTSTLPLFCYSPNRAQIP
jgi:hypothetical protein